jgi:two-component sensor histidine kinase
MKIWMKGNGGSELLKTAVEAGFQGGVIILTGDANLQTEIQGLNLGAIDFIDKAPVSLGTLGRNLQYAYSSLKREKKMASLIREKNILIKEVNHRIKENINHVIGLIQIERSEDGLDSGQTKNIIAQLQLMSTIHSQLMHGHHKSKVSLREYLGALIDNIIRLYQKEENLCIKYAIEIQDWVNWEKASQLSMLIYEIISSSEKTCQQAHQKEHSLDVRIYRQDKLTYLSIIDNGIPYQSNEEDLGLIIINSVCRNLELDYHRSYVEGNRWLFTFQSPGILLPESAI